MSIASWTSPAASGTTLPISRAISSATSSLRSASSWPKRKRNSPRFGAGVRRQSSKAAFAASTARSASSALERGKTPRVSPEAASIHSPPMKFLKVFVAAVATAAILVRRVGAGERARGPRPAAVANLALATLVLVPSGAPVVTLAAVDDDGYVRVVLVVLDHLVVELVLELARDDAIDHGARIVGASWVDARSGRSRV